MARTAIGLIAGPDRPPRVPASIGRRESTSIAIPSTVLISDNPSAPASITAAATSTIDVTLGESLGNTGVRASAPFTPLTTADADSAEWANMLLRSPRFGQEM